MRGFSAFSEIATPTTQIINLRSLTALELRVYQFFCRKIGSNRVPLYVSLLHISNACKLTNGRQAQYIVSKLIKKGLIERFTYFNAFNKKQSSYRLIIPFSESD